MQTEYYRIEWGHQCDSCPVQKQCTRSKSGRRTLVVGLRHDLVQRRREQMREAGFAKTMHPRNGVEGTHSELVRGHGLRRTKYRGLSRVGLSHYLMGAACNVKRYLNLLAFYFCELGPKLTKICLSQPSYLNPKHSSRRSEIKNEGFSAESI